MKLQTSQPVLMNYLFNGEEIFLTDYFSKEKYIHSYSLEIFMVLLGKQQNLIVPFTQALEFSISHIYRRLIALKPKREIQ